MLKIWYEDILQINITVIIADLTKPKQTKIFFFRIIQVILFEYEKKILQIKQFDYLIISSLTHKIILKNTNEVPV